MQVYPQESPPAGRRAASARPIQACSSSLRRCAASSSMATSTRLPIPSRIPTPDTNACWPHEAAPCVLCRHPPRPIDHSNRCKRPTTTAAVPPTSTPSSRVSTAPRRRCTTRHRSWRRPMLQPQPRSLPPVTRSSKRSTYQAGTNRRTIPPIIWDSTPSNRTEVRRCSYRNRRTIPILIIPALLLAKEEVGSVRAFGCPC